MNNEILIKGKVLNTKIEEDRRLIGEYGEILLMNYFISKSIKFKYMNYDNKYSRYDFKLNYDNKNYIIELKTRLEKLENHNIEILDYNKVQHYIYLRKFNNIKIIFIFNHIESENDNKFYYYEIDDIEEFENITFLNTKFKNKLYELPTKHLKSIENLFFIDN